MKKPIPKKPNDPLVLGRMVESMLERLVKQQTTDQVILTGWKDICKACGIRNTNTMRRWANHYKMPYARMFGRIVIPRVTLVEWVINLCKAVVNGDSHEDEIVRIRMKNLSMKRKAKANKEKVVQS